MTFIALSVAVFIAAAFLDFIEAYYVRSVADGRPHAAAIHSVSMYVIGCVGFFAVLEYSWWLMVPECLGLYAGSILAVNRQLKARNNSSRSAIGIIGDCNEQRAS